MILWEVFDVSNSIIESLLGHFTSFAWLVHDLIVEHREVKSETKSDWVGGLEVFIGLLSGIVVGGESVLSNLLVVLTLGVFTDVSVVVSFHLEEKDLAFSCGGLWD